MWCSPSLLRVLSPPPSSALAVRLNRTRRSCCVWPVLASSCPQRIGELRRGCECLVVASGVWRWHVAVVLLLCELWAVGCEL